MTCCTNIPFTFINEAVTSIPYDVAQVPNVEVVYFQDGQYLLGVFTQKKFVDGHVVVDHGGIQSGFIVLK